MINLGVRTNSIPNLLGEGIELTAKYNWRVGTQDTFGITIPTGYKCSWFVEDSRSYITVLTGKNTTVNQTFTEYTDSNGLSRAYDLVVIARKGILRIKRRFRRAFTVLPAVFTRASANLILTFNTTGVSYRDNNKVVRNNYKVWCEGVYTGSSYLGLEEWVSNIAEQPVHFMADPAALVEIRHTGTNWALRINRGCQNVLWDGCANPNTPYGFKFSTTAAAAQMVYIETADSTTTPTTSSMNIHFCGVHIDGGTTMLGAGFEVQTYNAGTVSYGLWEFPGFVMHDCLIENVQSEGIYLLRFTDNQGYAAATGMVIYRVKTNHTGADGLQWGLCNNSEMHDCEVRDAGYREDPNHKNGIQWNPGARGSSFYRNKVIGCKNTFSANLGTKAGNNECFSNLYVNRSVPDSNIYLALYQNDLQPTIDFKFFNSTIIAPNGVSELPFYIAKLSNGVTTEFDKLVAANNLIVSHNTTQYGTLNSPSLANAIISNYITANIATPQFVNSTDGVDDFRVLPTSPAYGTRVGGYTPVHPLSNEDVDGYEFDTNYPVRGCYSGASSRT